MRQWQRCPTCLPLNNAPDRWLSSGASLASNQLYEEPVFHHRAMLHFECAQSTLVGRTVSPAIVGQCSGFGSTHPYGPYGDSMLTIILHPNNNNDVSLFILFSLFTGALITIILLVMHGRIALVVALFTEASKCISAIPLILTIPVLSLFLGALVAAYFLGMLTFLISSGDPTVDNHGPSCACVAFNTFVA